MTWCDSIHVRDAKTGEYVLIDNRLTREGESLLNRNNPALQAELTPEGIFLRDEKGHSVHWRLEEAKPCVPEIEARETEDPAAEAEEKADGEDPDRIRGSAVYKEILPGADLRCELNGVHFKDELVFRTPEALAGAGEIAFILSLKGLALKQGEDGVRLLDESGETV